MVEGENDGGMLVKYLLPKDNGSQKLRAQFATSPSHSEKKE